MKRKQSEIYFRKMMKSYLFFVHKWRDRGYISCPHCHQTIMFCPRCKKNMIMPKAQTYPDFLAAETYCFVECKQGAESWSLYDFSESQEKVLDECMQDSWVFLVIGTGKAPTGKQAYLIEWENFKAIRSVQYKTSGSDAPFELHRSVRYENSERSRVPTAYEIFGDTWRLKWSKKYGWQIPVYHPFWNYHYHIPSDEEDAGFGLPQEESYE